MQGGESLSVQRQQLEELYLAHSGSMSILLEEDDGLQDHSLSLPQGPANFTLLWYTFSALWTNCYVKPILTKQKTSLMMIRLRTSCKSESGCLGDWTSVLQEVQLWDQGEGAEVALPKG